MMLKMSRVIMSAGCDGSDCGSASCPASSGSANDIWKQLKVYVKYTFIYGMIKETLYGNNCLFHMPYLRLLYDTDNQNGHTANNQFFFKKAYLVCVEVRKQEYTRM